MKDFKEREWVLMSQIILTSYIFILCLSLTYRYFYVERKKIRLSGKMIYEINSRKNLYGLVAIFFAILLYFSLKAYQPNLDKVFSVMRIVGILLVLITSLGRLLRKYELYENVIVTPTTVINWSDVKEYNWLSGNKNNMVLELKHNTKTLLTTKKLQKYRIRVDCSQTETVREIVKEKVHTTKDAEF